MLRELSNVDQKVELLYTNSQIAEMFVYDTLKKRCDANGDSIIDVKNQASFDEMVNLSYEYPILAKEWLFKIDYKRVKKLCAKYKGLFSSGSPAVFLVEVDGYKDFVEFKELVNNKCNPMYMSYLSYQDISYLFYEHKLPQKQISFIARSYSRDIDKVFELYQEVQNGYEITDIKSITAICGQSVGTTQSFVLSLLKLNIGDLKNSKTSIKRKIRELADLSKAIGCNRLRNYLMSTVKDIMYIKQLYLETDIYDEIKNLPKGYDEKRLSRYQRYLKDIKNIPMSSVLGLFTDLLDSGPWYKDSDAMTFLFNYYEKRRTN